jgi:hypothetical protein
MGLAVTVGLAPEAHADTKACAQAHVDAQKSMRAGALRQAREHLNACAREDCVAPIRHDCVGWRDEVMAAIPSVVVDAKGPDGNAVVDVRVTVAGEVIATKLDPRPIELDPGTYAFTFEREGNPPIDREVVLRRGEKGRILDVRFTGPAPTKPETSLREQPRAAARPTPIGPWVLGAAGLALAGVGAYFWLDAERRFDDAQTTCAPRCSRDRVDGIDTARHVGDVLMLVAAAAVAGAAVWLLTAPPSPRSSRLTTYPGLLSF